MGKHLGDFREVGLTAKVFERRTGRFILHQVAERRIAVFADRLIERGGPVGDRLHMHDLR